MGAAAAGCRPPRAGGLGPGLGPALMLMARRRRSPLPSDGSSPDNRPLQIVDNKKSAISIFQSASAPSPCWCCEAYDGVF